MANTTTREQATEALEIVKKIYKTRGYNAEVMDERLIALLTAEENDEFDTNAEKFRMMLWDTFTGGGVSAMATTSVFAALGRKDECDPNWC